ncbi:MAG: hypothetical protein JW751_01495 [Polyangiaceae bacterium]|nr:hypothetical protein [Polyangiaceae bacterium]
MRKHRLLVSMFATTVGHAATATAQYASPPNAPVVVYQPTVPQPYPPDCARPYPPPPDSWFRLQTGPALRLSDSKPAGGLLVAMEVGRRAAGFRASAAWLGVQQEEGIAQYTGELWVDFSRGGPLHPQVGAGGGLARVNALDENDGLTTENSGVALLRPGLHYRLPLDRVDARTGIDLIGVLPAVHGSSDIQLGPWLVVAASVTIGF